MGESERERDRERETSLSPSLMFLSPSLKWFRNGAFVISFFPPKTKANAKWGEGAAGWDLGRGGRG